MRLSVPAAGQLGLLVLLAVVGSVVDAQTCPPPVFPSIPAWAVPDPSAVPANAATVPFPLTRITDFYDVIVDAASPVAKAEGTQIYASGFLDGANRVVVRFQGGDSFTADSTNANFTQIWTPVDGVTRLTVDQRTGELFGLNSNADILHFASNGTVQTVLTINDFLVAYFKVANMSQVPTTLPKPSALAFDSASNLLVAVTSYNKNPMITVLQPAANGQGAVVTQITNSYFYMPGPYARDYAPRETLSITRMQFVRGYLRVFDNENGIAARTQFPYSSFVSAADFDQNPLVAETASNWYYNSRSVAVSERTGTVFTVVNGLVLQYAPLGGMAQLVPTESPCLTDTVRAVGKTSNYIVLDESAQPARLYTLGTAPLAWFNVSFTEYSAADAGCLNDQERATFTEAVPLPAFQEPASLLAQPVAATFAGASAALGLQSANNPFTTGANGFAFLAGLDAVSVPTVVKFKPGQSVNGSDVVPSSNWTMASAATLLVYRAHDDQLFALGVDHHVYVMNSSSTSAFVYINQIYPTHTLTLFAFDPQDRFFGVSASNSILTYEVVDPSTGAGEITVMANSDFHADSSFYQRASASNTWRSIAFANGFLYLVNPQGYDTVVRTLNPYCYHNASDFVTNPLVTVLNADYYAEFTGLVFEPQTGALFAGAPAYYETVRNDDHEVFMQYQQVGSGNYIQAGWRYPCLANTLANPMGRKKYNEVQRTVLSLDLSVTPARLYAWTIDDIGELTYTLIPKIQPALPQSALSCLAPCATPGGCSSAGSSSGSGQSSSGPAGGESSSSGSDSSSSSSTGETSSASMSQPMSLIVALALAAVAIML